MSALTLENRGEITSFHDFFLLSEFEYYISVRKQRKETPFSSLNMCVKVQQDVLFANLRHLFDINSFLFPKEKKVQNNYLK